MIEEPQDLIIEVDRCAREFNSIQLIELLQCYSLYLFDILFHLKGLFDFNFFLLGVYAPIFKYFDDLFPSLFVLGELLPPVWVEVL